MSSFRRIAKKESIQTNGSNGDNPENTSVKAWGVKPHASGRGVASTGQRQFDEILGGGHVFGSSMMIFEDNYSDYAITLLRYELAEAISMRHHVVVLLTGPDSTLRPNEAIVTSSSSKTIPSNGLKLLQSLPMNLNGLRDENISMAGDNVDSNKRDDDRSDNVNDDHPDNDEGPDKTNNTSELKIAWQYQKYIPSQSGIRLRRQFVAFQSMRFLYCPLDSSGTSKKSDLQSVFGCSYDLAKRLQQNILQSNTSEFIECHGLTNEALSREVINRLHRISLSCAASDVIRIFIPSMEQLCDSSEVISDRSIAQFMLSLTRFIRDKRMTLTTSCLAACLPSSQLATQLFNLSDTVIEIDSFAGKADAVPYEFKEFVGFLSIRQIQKVNVMASHRPQYEKYGLKRNRRKLSIEPLHLPPEESRAFGSAGTDEHFKNKAIAQSKAASDTRSPHSSSQSSQENAHKGSNNPTGRITLAIEEEPAAASTQPPLTNMQIEGKKKLANSLALARANRQASKSQATQKSNDESIYRQTSSIDPSNGFPACSRSDLEF